MFIIICIRRSVKILDLTLYLAVLSLFSSILQRVTNESCECIFTLYHFELMDIKMCGL
jgi:hypothetical protein